MPGGGGGGGGVLFWEEEEEEEEDGGARKPPPFEEEEEKEEEELSATLHPGSAKEPQRADKPRKRALYHPPKENYTTLLHGLLCTARFICDQNGGGEFNQKSY